MSHPRETMSHGTLAQVTTKALGDVMGIFPRTTFTEPNSNAVVRSPFGGGYQTVSQDAVAEGEIAIHYYQEFGIRLADLYVAIDIDGTLIWKRCHFYNFTSNRNTAERNA